MVVQVTEVTFAVWKPRGCWRRSISAPKSVTLTNTGTVTQPVSARLNGANFSNFAQTNDCGSTIAPGASCTLSVTFAPGVRGTFTALLVIDGTLDEEAIVRLTGSGT